MTTLVHIGAERLVMFDKQQRQTTEFNQKLPAGDGRVMSLPPHTFYRDRLGVL